LTAAGGAQFDGKVALVTGGSSGIGAAAARLLADQGASVAIAGTSAERLESVRAEIARGGRPTLALRGDVASENDVERMTTATLKEFGHIDILVNSAGVVGFRPAEDYPREEWDRIMAVDCTGVFLSCRAVGRAMIKRGAGGRIINVSSTAGLAAVPQCIAYTAAKHAVIGITRALSVEWAPYGITVNCVCPGLTDTPQSFGSRARAPEVFAERVRRIPLGRPATALEQAAPIVFLASPQADYITGVVLPVDGGNAALFSGFPVLGKKSGSVTPITS
jgi:NAD(P)-dependent dehydrogenase (short-subunit alcohol dehydrogenase family)